jgi:Helix-turn-helix domain
MDEDFLTTAEVASRYRTVPETVRYWRHIGYGPLGIKVGRRVLYPVKAVQEWDRKLAAEQGGAVPA